MLKNGCYKLTRAQADALVKVVLDEKTNPKTGKTSLVVNRDCVGRDARVILAKIGINVGPEIRCAIAEVDFNHPFVQEELMMPILGIVRVKNIDEAIDLAVKAEHGNRHTAHMHSKNIDNLSRFAKAVEPLPLLPLIPPSIRVFSNVSTLRMRWPKYWSFSFSISSSNEHPGLISFRMDWLDLCAVQGTLKSLL